MGFFSYLCNGCNKNLVFDGFCGEKVVLKHVRHGVVIGETSGEYDGFGRVLGDPIFRNKDPQNPNCHEEVWKSEYKLDDSGKHSGVIAFHQYCHDGCTEEQRSEIRISKHDPDQGFSGTGVKKPFC